MRCEKIHEPLRENSRKSYTNHDFNKKVFQSDVTAMSIRTPRLLQHLQCLSNERPPASATNLGFPQLAVSQHKVPMAADSKHEAHEVWTLAPRSLSNTRTPSPPKTCNGSPKASSEGRSAMLVGPLGWPGQKIRLCCVALLRGL